MMGRLSPDELTIYFQSDRDTATGGTVDLYMATRATRTDPFDPPIALASVNSSADNDADPSVSADGLTLFIGRSNAAFDVADIFVSTRSSTLTTFGTPALATLSHPTARDLQPFETTEALWFTSERSGSLGGFDIYRAAKTGGTFGAAVAITALNSTADDWMPTIGLDGLVVYFSSTRPGAGAAGLFDIWSSTRADRASSFGPPAIVPELNSAFQDFPSWLSPDGCRLYLSSERLGSPDIYIATRLP